LAVTTVGWYDEALDEPSTLIAVTRLAKMLLMIVGPAFCCTSTPVPLRDGPP